MILQIITKVLRDDKLRKELFYTKDLDFNKAKNICHLYHSAESSNVVLTGGADTEVSLVKSRGAKGGASGGDRRGKPPGVCHFCKLPGHWIRDCQKRKDLVCENCKGKGHSAKVCKKARVLEIQQQQQTREDNSTQDLDESF